MTEKPPLTTAEHIARAKGHLAEGAPADLAIAHALVALAELMATNMTDAILDATSRGAVAMAESIGTILSVVNPGGPIQTNVNAAEQLGACGQQCDCHARLNPGIHCSACDPTGDVEVAAHPDVCASCDQHYDNHSNDDLSCPCHLDFRGEIVFSTTRRYTPRNSQ